MIRTTVIIAFYNKLDYLKLVLAGFERQSVKDFEILIADDGSSAEVTAGLETVMNNSPLTIYHLWHEDKGWRKNKILNEAVKAASADYLIFVDGDCVPHKNFVEEHLNARAEKVSLTGRRVNLSEKITSRLTPERVKAGALDNGIFKLMLDGIFGKSFDVEKGFYFRSEPLRKFFNKKKRGLLGCNFSVNKTDMLAVNGFDERYDAPSVGEDSDVQFRLELTGVAIRSLNNIAVQYHLYHKIQPRLQKNLDLFDMVKKLGKAYSDFGINKNI